MPFVLDRLYLFHWVTPEAARSAQPWLGFYGPYLKAHGFAAIVNLRGENPSFRWWHSEKRVAAALGIKHFDVKLSSRNIPSRASLTKLFDAFESGAIPMLFKCSGGQDRTALASALFLLFRKGAGALAEAEKQFSFWPYFHHAKRFQRWLKEFPAYAVKEAAGHSIGAWVREGYRPEAFADYLKAKGLDRSYRTIQSEGE